MNARTNLPYIRRASFLWLAAVPLVARAESGYATAVLGLIFVVLVFFVAPVALLLHFVVRSFRRGKHEGHAEYLHKHADVPPVGRLGE